MLRMTPVFEESGRSANSVGHVIDRPLALADAIGGKFLRSQACPLRDGLGLVR